MPNRIPTPGIPTPGVRKSPAAHPAAKPVENAAKVIKQYQARISPTGMAKAQSQMAKAQADLQAKRMKGSTYDSSGTN